MLQNNVSKSAQDKAERQQKTQSEISFWEKQKENLKNQECESVEEIAEKLKALHSYEDEIAAAKQSFNNEQMWHILDEAEELGEKIAEAAEKMEPKTAEERREDMAEEAVGTDGDETMMEEMMEDVSDLAEEVEAVEENAKELEEIAEETEEMQEAKEAQEKLAEETKQMEEQEQEMEEQQLVARLQARNIEAYQASGKRHPYQALDLLV
jgi:uncharacterized coiled-coil DUF342 family protein